MKKQPEVQIYINTRTWLMVRPYGQVLDGNIRKLVTKSYREKVYGYRVYGCTS